jgi:hypothetical protein
VFRTILPKIIKHFQEKKAGKQAVASAIKEEEEK